MSGSGKYDALSLEELQALRAAMNAEEEPERAAEIDAAIVRKQEAIAAVPDVEAAPEAEATAEPVSSAAPADTTVTRSVSHESAPADTQPSATDATFETVQSADTLTAAQPDDRLASLGERLGGAIIDMVVNILASLPLFFFLGAEAMADPTFTMLVGSIAYSLFAYVVINGYFLVNNAQTVGKHFINTRIENLDGTQSSFTNILVKRYLPLALVVNIPFIGFIAALVDIFFIFRKDRRCVHDFIAGTRVCRVPESINA